MILQETYKLENGTKIPKLGLGTWCIDNDCGETGYLRNAG